MNISDADRQKRSERMKKLWQDPEYRKMQTELHSGKKQSQETIAKRVEKNLGQRRPGKCDRDFCERARLKSIRWAEEVKSRDGHICQICGREVAGYECCAHHVRDWDRHPELRYDVNNGITLCRTCHRRFHSFVRLVKSCSAEMILRLLGVGN